MRSARAAILLVALALGACDAATPSTAPAAQAVPGETGAVAPASATPAPQVTVSPVKPVFREVPCPDEVTRVVVVVPTCGELTVPERRDRNDTPTITDFVVRIDPVDGGAAPDPVVVVGDTLGNTMEYGGLVTVAQRTGRVSYLVDRRGTGQSRPSLACPEIAAAAPASLKIPTRDPAALEPVVEAVRACRSRLESAGIDVAAYDIEESARDIEDLRLALGAPPWNVIGFGTASRLALEVARVAPAGVRSVVMDSPVLPQGPDPAFNIDAARAAVTELAGRCAQEPACNRRYPDVAATLKDAAATLEAKPLIAHADGAQGPVDVLVDGARFGRVIRTMLAERAGQSVAAVLPLAESVIAGKADAGDLLATRVARDDGLCLGYFPECSRLVPGSLLTTVCRDTVPFVDRSAYLAASDNAGGMSLAFTSNPLFAACDAWDVPPADASVVAPVSTSIPVLALGGQFDSYTGPLATSREAAGGLAQADFLSVPNQAYNVFGYDECPRAVRRAWLADPGAGAALDTGCFASLPLVAAYRAK